MLSLCRPFYLKNSIGGESIVNLQYFKHMIMCYLVPLISRDFGFFSCCHKFYHLRMDVFAGLICAQKM
jgi:hypothetical protein